MPFARSILIISLLLGSAFADDIRLIRVGESWNYLRGHAEPATNGATRWFEPGYPADWSAGQSGFSSGIAYNQATVLGDYGSQYRTIYFRKEFSVRDPSNIADLILRIEYNDGFVAYLNGQEVARRGVEGEPGVPVPVTAMAELHVTDNGEVVLLQAGIPLLRPGTNLLAIQLLGSAVSDASMRFVPELLANVIRGPYVQNTTLDSTQIIWKTMSPVLSGIEYGTNLASMEWMPVAANTNEHVATIRGLVPDTEYFYRLVNQFGVKETYSDWKSFRTFKRSGKVTFNVVGDSGWGSLGQFQIAEQMEKSPADFLMHMGDLVYYAITHGNADLRLFSVYAGEMSRRPWFLAVGNHENYLDPQAALQCFHLPTNAVTGTEHFYSFDHGDVHVTVAWSDLAAGATYHPGSPQYQWLDADLANTSKPWKFLFFHHTWRTSSAHQGDDYDLNTVPDSKQMDEGLVELARKHGVQIIFNGHDHCYERLAPSGGPISFVSGGGGANPYFMTSPHPDDVQFHAKYHFLRVTVEGGTTRVEAVDEDGSVFDTVNVRRELPARVTHEAAFHTPTIEAESHGPSDFDGNIAGQRFDFAGLPINGLMGQWSSAGRLFVNNDRTNLYFGFDEVMLGEGEELLLFLEVPGLPGRTNLVGLGNGIVDPHGEGVDALDFLENVAFTNFRPSIAVVLGDEFADAGSRAFQRSGQKFSSGQGAFYLANAISTLPEQRLTQFNRSPQLVPMGHEQNADFMEVALPLSWLGGLKMGDRLRVAAVNALNTVDTNNTTQTRAIDTGGIGFPRRDVGGVTWIEGVEVKLASLADFDGDGLTDEEERTMETNWLNPDSDGDGMPDGWEVTHSLHPMVKNGNVDVDGDGLTNGMEFRAGTNPRLAASALAIQTEPTGDGGWRVTWSAVPGKRYKLECRDTLAGAFRDVAGGLFPRVAQGPKESFRIDLSPDAPQNSRYYRVQLVDEVE